MSRPMRYLRIFGLLVALAMLAVVLGMLVPRPLWSPGGQEGAEARRILVLSNPIHTDIAIPLDAERRAEFAFLEADGIPVTDPAAEWLIVGWGGRAFYLETPTWSELKAGPLFKALTIDRSVLHFDVTGAIDETHPAVTPFEIDENRLDRLVEFVEASFVREAGAVIAIPDAGYGTYDRFFEAHGYFNALVGCNTWTAAALRTAGLRTGLWNPVPQTLSLSLKLFN